MDWLEAADRLYAEAGDDFVETRKQLVTQLRTAGDKDGAKQLAAVRKPTLAAWVVNRTVRQGSAAIGTLFQVGSALREATATADAPAMRKLTRRRNDAVDAACRAAADQAGELGRTLTASALDQVRQTFDAAVLDPTAAAAVRAARLTVGLQFVGFGLVDESGNPIEFAATDLAESSAPDPESDPNEESDEESTVTAEDDSAQDDSAQDDSDEDAETGPARLVAVDSADPQRRRARSRARTAVDLARMLVQQRTDELTEKSEELAALDLRLAGLTNERAALATEVDDLTDDVEAATEQLETVTAALEALDD